MSFAKLTKIGLSLLVGLLVAQSAQAQTFTVVYAFQGRGDDGAYPCYRHLHSQRRVSRQLRGHNIEATNSTVTLFPISGPSHKGSREPCHQHDLCG